MKKSIILSAILLLSLTSSFAGEGDWSVSKSTHFIVYYKNAPAGFISQVIESSERYYNDIADNLGFRRYNFWLWDNRAKIYIYDNAQDYYAATGQPGWSGGVARVELKEIVTFAYAQKFCGTILPHEIGHIIFREFVGFYNPALPVWLEEGVASYQESIRRSSANRLVKEAVKTGLFISLERLNNLSPQSMQSPELVSLFYAESLSIVDFLIKEYGSNIFVYFCQNLRDKKDFNAALRATYSFSNIKDLEQVWLRSLEKK